MQNNKWFHFHSSDGWLGILDYKKDTGKNNWQLWVVVLGKTVAHSMECEKDKQISYWRRTIYKPTRSINKEVTNIRVRSYKEKILFEMSINLGMDGGTRKRGRPRGRWLVRKAQRRIIAALSAEVMVKSEVENCYTAFPHYHITDEHGVSPLLFCVHGVFVR